MGVKGLWSLVEPCARPVRLETLTNKRLAVDASIWLHQFLKAMRDKEGNALKGAHIVGFFRRICKLIFYGVKPVFVFDGATPTMKKLAITERRKRKAGKEKSLKRTAEKILSAQLKMRALKEVADAAGLASERSVSMPKNISVQRSDAITELPQDAVYIDDLTALIRSGSNSRANSASPEKNISPPKNVVKRKRDEYELPEGVDESAIDAALHDPRLVSEQELRDFISDHKSSINIDSHAFTQLPIETQHSIILDQKNKSRQSSYKRLEAMVRAAPTAQDFSKLQIKNLVQRNYYTERLANFRGSAGGVEKDNGGKKKKKKEMGIRVASERNREYVLVKNDDTVGGGWSFKANAVTQKVVDKVAGGGGGFAIKTGQVIDLEEDSPVKKPSSGTKTVKVDDDSSSSAGEDEEDEFEDIPGASTEKREELLEDVLLDELPDISMERPNEEASTRGVLTELTHWNGIPSLSLPDSNLPIPVSDYDFDGDMGSDMQPEIGSPERFNDSPVISAWDDWENPPWEYQRQDDVPIAMETSAYVADEESIEAVMKRFEDLENAQTNDIRPMDSFPQTDENLPPPPPASPDLAARGSSADISYNPPSERELLDWWVQFETPPAMKEEFPDDEWFEMMRRAVHEWGFEECVDQAEGARRRMGKCEEGSGRAIALGFYVRFLEVVGKWKANRLLDGADGAVDGGVGGGIGGGGIEEGNGNVSFRVDGSSWAIPGDREVGGNGEGWGSRGGWGGGMGWVEEQAVIADGASVTPPGLRLKRRSQVDESTKEADPDVAIVAEAPSNGDLSMADADANETTLRDANARRGTPPPVAPSIPIKTSPIKLLSLPDKPLEMTSPSPRKAIDVGRLLVFEDDEVDDDDQEDDTGNGVGADTAATLIGGEEVVAIESENDDVWEEVEGQEADNEVPAAGEQMDKENAEHGRFSSLEMPVISLGSLQPHIDAVLAEDAARSRILLGSLQPHIDAVLAEDAARNRIVDGSVAGYFNGDSLHGVGGLTGSFSSELNVEWLKEVTDEGTLHDVTEDSTLADMVGAVQQNGQNKASGLEFEEDEDEVMDDLILAGESGQRSDEEGRPRSAAVIPTPEGASSHIKITGQAVVATAEEVMDDADEGPVTPPGLIDLPPIGTINSVLTDDMDIPDIIPTTEEIDFDQLHNIEGEGEVEPDSDDDEEKVDVPTALDTEVNEYARFVSTLSSHRSIASATERLEQEMVALNAQKRKEMRDASDITQSMINETQELLRLFGLPYIVAPMEAESQCAFLAAENLVDGIVTDDSDVFLFGGKNVYRNMFNQQRYVEQYEMKTLEERLGLGRERMVALAYLLGSDYTEGVGGVGPVGAMEVLDEFGGGEVEAGDGEGLAEVLGRFREWWGEVWREGALEGGKRKGESPVRRKMRKLLLQLPNPPPATFPDPRVRDAYLHPQLDTNNKPMTWGVPDLNGIRDFMEDKLGWGQGQVDEVVVPVVKEMEKREKEGAQVTLERFFETKAGGKAKIGSERVERVVGKWIGGRGDEGSSREGSEEESGTGSEGGVGIGRKSAGVKKGRGGKGGRGGRGRKGGKGCDVCSVLMGRVSSSIWHAKEVQCTKVSVVRVAVC
ncbi:DNA repair protein rad2 [Rhizophlyctis rosea]|nr:DNA repair protein rad2 [Rhizophlyctis rosea]